jgi:hypothetical protein
MNPTEREPGKDQPKPAQPGQPMPQPPPLPKKTDEEEPSETPGQ